MTTAEAPSGRGSLAYLLAAAVIVVIVGVLVVTLGVTRPPDLASIASAADKPSAGVAWVQWNDTGSCGQLRVARPDGTVGDLACDANFGEVVAWTDAGILVTRWGQNAQQLETRDAVTGDLISTAEVSDAFVPVAGRGVMSERTRGELVVRLESGTTVVWRVKVTSGYDVSQGRVSPDGRWVAMVDTSERLLLVPADGSAEPVVWAKGVTSSSSIGPVWEGTALGPGKG